MDTLAPLVAATLSAATPLLLAALGVLVVERTGVVNLGVEGMMLMGAMTAFAVAHTTGNPALGFVAGAGAGMALALVFAALALGLGANQYATGLALALFGGGLSAFAGQPWVGDSLVRTASQVPGLGAIPWLGEAMFRQHPLVYVAWGLCAVVAWMLFRSRMGLVVRAIGESPEAAHALGYRVRTVRTLAVLFGGACAGLAGAYLSLVYTPFWVEDMVAGRGWIALALVVFATWRPGRLFLGALLFGGATLLQFNLQAAGVAVPSQWLAMSPYVATIVVLAAISRNAMFIRLNMPASLGRAFRP